MKDIKDIMPEINRLLSVGGNTTKAPAMGPDWRYNPRPIIATRRMSDIEPELISWLWPARMACGKVTLIAGDPGLGKSMLTCAMASHVSRGTPWPVDRSPCPHGDTIMVSAEDDPGDTIRPRLDAAGADISRVHVLTMVSELDRDGNPVERSFNLARISLALMICYARRLNADSSP